MVKEEILKKINPILADEHSDIFKCIDDKYQFMCPFCYAIGATAKQEEEIFFKCTNEQCRSKGKTFTVLSFIKKNKAGYENLTESQLLQKLVDEYDLEKQEISDDLDYFSRLVQYGWCFVKDEKNGNETYEDSWTKTENRNPMQANQWIADGWNISARTGKVSNCTCIDFDAEIPEEIKDILGDTFIEQTRKGFHYAYQYEADLQSTRLEDLQIDIINDGGKFTIYPSIVGGVKRTLINNTMPIKMPKALKDFLLSNFTEKQKKKRDRLLKKLGEKEGTKNDKQQKDISNLDKFEFDIKKIGNHGGRNVKLVSILGALRKRYSLSECKYIGTFINENFFSPPLDYGELCRLFESLEQYQELDNHDLSDRIMEYMMKVKKAKKDDILMMLTNNHNEKFKESERVDIVLSNLVDEDLLIRRSYEFEYYNAPQFSFKWDEEEEDYNLKLPYFPHSIWSKRSTLIIGAQTGRGKTHIAMNIINQLKAQNILPAYISTEIDSKYTKIGRFLKLKEGDFHFARCQNLNSIRLVKDCINIIDWVVPPDGNYAMMEVFFSDLKDKQLKANAFVIVFMQLREGNIFFAKDMVKNFATDVYIFDNDWDSEKKCLDRKKGTFTPVKIRDAKEDVVNPWETIPVKFDFKTKKLEVLSDAIKKEQEESDGACQLEEYVLEN